jgi:hypothetical protein
MKKLILNIFLGVFVLLFMISCGATKKGCGCGLAQTTKHIKKAPIKTFNTDTAFLEAR